MRVITVTQNRTTAPWSYDVSYRDLSDKKSTFVVDRRADADAAAIALDKALSYHYDYIMIGAEEVMKHIPENLRKRGI